MSTELSLCKENEKLYKNLSCALAFPIVFHEIKYHDDDETFELSI